MTASVALYVFTSSFRLTLCVTFCCLMMNCSKRCIVFDFVSWPFPQKRIFEVYRGSRFIGFSIKMQLDCFSLFRFIPVKRVMRFEMCANWPFYFLFVKMSPYIVPQIFSIPCAIRWNSQFVTATHFPPAQSHLRMSFFSFFFSLCTLRLYIFCICLHVSFKRSKLARG